MTRPVASSHGGPRERRAVPPVARRSRTSSPRRGRSRPTRPSPPRRTRRPPCTTRPRRDFEAFWAKQARERIDWVDAVRDDPRVGPAVREVVRRRRAQRRLQLRRPARRARPRRQGRLPLDRRAGRHPDAHLRATSSARSARPPTRSGSSASETGDRVAIYMPMIPELPIAMLACARIGAPHTVVFGGFSAEALSRPDQRLRRQGPDHRRRRLAARQGGRPQAPRRRGARRHADDRARPSSSTGSATACHMVEGRDHWWHEIVDRQSDDCPPVPVDSEHMLYLLYTSGTTAKPKGILHTTAGYLLGTQLHPRGRLRHQARRRLLVRRRHRLGDRPQLHRLRPARQRHDRDHVRGRARHAGLGPLVADRRGLQGHDPVLRPDRHPRLHEAGRGVPGAATTSRRCASSARSASRSTPRPGSGTTSTSAAAGRPIVDTWWQTETGQILITPAPRA